MDLSFCKPNSAVTTFRGHPGRNYVFGRAQLSRLSGHQEFNASILKQSLLDPRLANFVPRSHVQENQNKVLLYNGCGGYGDQIMTWPLALFLHTLGYQVHVLVDPGNEDCWANFPWVRSINCLPMDMNVFAMFNHHAVFEVVSNMDEHTPQHHPLDAMLNKIGVNPASIEKSRKYVEPVFSHSELTVATQIVAGRRIGIYQMSAASRTRSLTPDESTVLLFRLASEFPDITWLAVFDGSGHSSIFHDSLKQHPANVVPFVSQSLRVLWAVISKAVICVGPDSMVAHIAGSMAKPMVGLWGPVDPATRVKYYRNHWALFPRDGCHMAPCHAYTNTFPRYCPSLNMPQCAVLSSISFQDVVSSVRSQLASPQSNL